MLAASSQHAQASRLPAGARFRGASRPGWARCERRPCLGRPGRPTGRRLAAAGGSPAPARWAAAHGRCWGPVHAPQRRPQAGPADPRRPGRQLPLVRRRRRCRPAAAEGAWQRRTATIRRRSIAGRGRAGDTESLRSLGQTLGSPVAARGTVPWRPGEGGHLFYSSPVGLASRRQRAGLARLLVPSAFACLRRLAGL